MLKYGIVTYADRPVKKGNKNKPNLGDPIQTYAMKYIYRQMGIPEEELVEVSRYQAKNYDGEYVVLPFNCFNMVWNQSGRPYGTLPLSEKIIPVFTSFHLHSRVLSDEITANLRQFEPVGCRDEETLKNMRKHGIRAYLSGCVTAVLPKRKTTPSARKVFFVDIPESVKPYIPEELLEAGEFVSHQPLFCHDGDGDVMTREEYELFYQNGVRQLERYRDEATLVVTSRLHAATPCMAMGIPVVLVSNRFDQRFSFLDRYLPLYTPEQFNQIDWNPAPAEYEKEKQMVLNMFIRQIRKTYDEYKEICEVREFYESRTKAFYNQSFVNDILQLKEQKDGRVRYALWGVTSQSLQLIHVIQDYCPDWEYVGMIDRKVTGEFEGKPVVTSDEIANMDDDIIYFIVPEAAQKAAAELLSGQKRQYVLAKENGLDMTYVFD
ncbi:MAG: polysaccharide pyruvyl transferase family protein [Butyribacter sp.]|nr:polysaccharide pyruvyl transferase family protein [bacterium]MDY3853697.1 polysaccharide pyruvyl transferase family protein [Butyribacter sp.]